MISIAQKKYLESKVTSILNGIIFGCIPQEAAQKLTEMINSCPMLKATQHNNIVMIHDINEKCILIVVFKHDGCVFKKPQKKSPVFYDALALVLMWIDDNVQDDLDDISSDDDYDDDDDDDDIYEDSDTDSDSDY
jgi:hypothetical protein